jgi:hypothetical protein
VGIKERLAAVEAKLGIEIPTDGACIGWDRGDRLNGSLNASRYDDDGYDTMENWDHFIYLTPEIIAAIKALPEGEK